MKHPLSLALSALLLLGALSACSPGGPSDGADAGPQNTAAPNQTPALLDTPEDSDIPSASDTRPEDHILAETGPSARSAYRALLEGVLDRCELPGVGTIPDTALYGDLSDNQFAVYDVDRDGQEELVVLFTTTITAGYRGLVYAWNSQSETIQLCLDEYPALTFYDNGAVIAEWSHNQGYSGEALWPYFLYRYLPEFDTYELVGAVNAWSKACLENGFPAELDADGDGVVYYVMPSEYWELYDRFDPVDGPAYEAWLDSYLGGAAELEIPYQSITPENAAALDQIS